MGDESKRLTGVHAGYLKRLSERRLSQWEICRSLSRSAIRMLYMISRKHVMKILHFQPAVTPLDYGRSLITLGTELLVKDSRKLLLSWCGCSHVIYTLHQ
eukprot:1369817-Pyramimonas_sp.AAC.1